MRKAFRGSPPRPHVDPGLLLPIVAGLVVLNLAGAVLAVVDKRRARRGGRRVRESMFHLLAFFGAWPGILLAFLAAHHKTRKLRFQVPFVLASAAGTGIQALIVAGLR